MQVAELPLPAKVQVVDHPLSDQVDLSAGERRETEPFVVGRSDTIKIDDQVCEEQCWLFRFTYEGLFIMCRRSLRK